MEAEKSRLSSTRVRADSPVAQAAGELSGHAVSGSPTLEELLRRPHVHYRVLEAHGLDAAPGVGRAEREGVEIDIKYAGFITRQVRVRVGVRSAGGRVWVDDGVRRWVGAGGLPSCRGREAKLLRDACMHACHD